MMMVHHLDAGPMFPRPSTLVNDRGRLVCHVLVVESDDGLVVVDTGMGRDDVADPAGRLGRQFLLFSRPRLAPSTTVHAQLIARGLDPEDVRHVVPTHLDVDHAGGLADFTSASVHVDEQELDAARARRSRSDRDRYREPHWQHGPRWVTSGRDHGAWKGFRGVTEVVDGVLRVPLPGHTVGHQAVAVRTGDRWLLHAGDAYFHHDEMDPTDPRCSLGLRLFQRFAEHDRATRLTNQDRLRQLARDHDDVTVFCAHDPVRFDQLSSAPTPE